NLTEATASMHKAVRLLKDSLIGIRSGGITANVLDTVRVEYDGQLTPIKHLAQTIDGQGKVLITPYDPSLLGAIVAALMARGFNAYVFSKSSVAVSASPLSGEQREQVQAQVRRLGEEARISVRGVRRRARQKLDSKLPRDERRRLEAEIDRLTDEAIGEIDRIVEAKLASLA